MDLGVESAAMTGPIVLISGATRSIRTMPFLGRLIQPRSQNVLTKVLSTQSVWAIDNGAYSAFDEALFRRCLIRAAKHHSRPLWVVAPDVVGDATRTRHLWDRWYDVIAGMGFSVAFVLQDGIEDAMIPWDACAAVFIGGSTTFKLGPQVTHLVAVARERGRWVHMGRVNSYRRWKHAIHVGCDSIDGSMFSWFPDTALRRLANWQHRAAQQPDLFGMGQS